MTAEIGLQIENTGPLSVVDQTRLEVSRRTGAEKKSCLGQFLTPASTAAFMAGLFPRSQGECRLLDAGAGIGSLSSAFLERCVNGEMKFDAVQIAAFEIDPAIQEELQRSLSYYTEKCPLSYEIVGEDFVEEAVNSIQFQKCNFTHAILNPPYKKIRSNSRYRELTRQVGIETVNLYSTFVALAIALTQPNGQIVAIIPRSFCNGPYYRPFREFIFAHTAIQHIHLFASRDKAFRDDDVLQETIIIRLEREAKQGSVTVSTSTDNTFSDLTEHTYPFEQIVQPDNSERFIHIPTSSTMATGLPPIVRHTLDELGIKVSTGPVVDFRLREHLREMPGPDCAPLLYPGHFSNGGITWPATGEKKRNAIRRSADTEKWLYPCGFYCVVRRFSSKEEKRRVVASVVDPSPFGDADALGFENHLNLFHENKRSLPQALAHGLAVFLNSTLVDDYFRRFSGHTQVNATDLKFMKYPSRGMLLKLGKWAMRNGKITQAMIDNRIHALFT
ncbi:MAG: Eco57I restriction-modification methylase domain-containing protein [Gammaproteobacteria bacterium]|nr:Eco57I restriction-modification methylase domain-containing protein [Gammaproteobacteria bacterium]